MLGLADLRFLTTKHTSLTSRRRRSPSEFLSLKPQRKSKPRILAGCATRRSPHRPALRRSTSIYSGGARRARRRVVFPIYELICATFQVREDNLPRYNLRECGCGHVVHEALVFSFASTGPMGSSASPALGSEKAENRLIQPRSNGAGWQACRR